MFFERCRMKTTTESEITTSNNSLDGEHTPFVTMTKKEDGRIWYTPKEWEKDLVQYKLTMVQGVSPEGKLGTLWMNISADNSKNRINDRFEILDL